MFKNIFIAFSIVLNAGLLMYVAGVFPVLLFLSLLVIIALSWYIRQLITRVQTIDSDFEALYNKLDQFGTHLESIHELEMFYGDETLQSLIMHSQEIMQNIAEYQMKYIAEDVFGDEEYEEGEPDTDDYEETEETPVERKQEE